MRRRFEGMEGGLTGDQARFVEMASANILAGSLAG